MARQKQSDQDERDEEDRQRFADRVLLFFEDAVYWAIAVVLVVGSGALVVSQFNTLLRLREAPAKAVMLEVLDGLPPPTTNTKPPHPENGNNGWGNGGEDGTNPGSDNGGGVSQGGQGAGSSQSDTKSADENR